ncbi:hypothetical protein BDV29DRAFT_155043 [Aspergillus leporis]|uniref:Uncharacterized protein n=1 Tax=Aspergillus leporis TaxID=41062 RepID=A0A5N5X622_9EURO|nr:hypothetical protein BDV29DRAFT_155043 [Aspergillus leporis]
MNMGMAFYGRSVTRASSSCTEPDCTYLSAGNKGACSDTAGVLFNNEIQQIINNKEVIPTMYKDATVKTLTWDKDHLSVWSIDNDDSKHTFSNGLAAALGNETNLNTASGLTTSSFSRKSTSSSSDKG